MLITYDSMEHFATESEKVLTNPKSQYPNSNRKNPSAWNGGLDWKTSVGYCRNGNESMADKTAGLLDALEVSLPATNAMQTIRSPFGGRCNYGDWMAGYPNPMRRRVKRHIDVAPIKVAVCLTSSAEITSDTLEKRGVAILALVMKIQQVRPIDLSLIIELGCGGKDLFQVIPIQSRPFALGQAAFGLCHTAMSRQLGYAIADQYGFTGLWPRRYQTPGWGESRNEYERERRRECNIGESDIVIDEASSSDLYINDPVQWITNQLTKINAVETAESR